MPSTIIFLHSDIGIMVWLSLRLYITCFSSTQHWSFSLWCESMIPRHKLRVTAYRVYIPMFSRYQSVSLKVECKSPDHLTRATERFQQYTFPISPSIHLSSKWKRRRINTWDEGLISTPARLPTCQTAQKKGNDTWLGCMVLVKPPVSVKISLT